jgi:SnoaL-like domain
MQKSPGADDNVTDGRRESQFGGKTMANDPQTLEQRIRAIEDRLEIYNLIASHPPSADTGDAGWAEAAYTEDGLFDRGPGLSGAAGNKALGALLQSDGHQAAIAGGLAHFTGLPYVTIDGDEATVISYLQILTPKKSGEAVEVPNHGASRGYHIHRVVTNRWELVRSKSEWRIKRRTLRLVDGTPPSRELLRGALEAYRA